MSNKLNAGTVLPARLDAELLALGLGPGASGFVPPPEVRAAAAAGLALRATHKRGGTDVGLARAEALSAGRALGAIEMRQAAGWFARFAYLAGKRGWGDEAAPSTGWIAWQLWGGDPGRAWVEAERARWQGGGGAEV